MGALKMVKQYRRNDGSMTEIRDCEWFSFFFFFFFWLYENFSFNDPTRLLV